jgi:hypothetical protein
MDQSPISRSQERTPSRPKVVRQSLQTQMKHQPQNLLNHEKKLKRKQRAQSALPIKVQYKNQSTYGIDQDEVQKKSLPGSVKKVEILKTTTNSPAKSFRQSKNSNSEEDFNDIDESSSILKSSRVTDGMNRELAVWHTKLENLHKQRSLSPNMKELKRDQIAEIEHIEEVIKLAQYRVTRIVSSGIEHFEELSVSYVVDIND